MCIRMVSMWGVRFRAYLQHHASQLGHEASYAAYRASGCALTLTPYSTRWSKSITLPPSDTLLTHPV